MSNEIISSIYFVFIAKTLKIDMQFAVCVGFTAVNVGCCSQKRKKHRGGITKLARCC